MTPPFIRYSDFWQQSGDFSDVFLSGVVEMRRNLSSYPFCNKMNESDRSSLLGLFRDRLSPVSSLNDDFLTEADAPLFREQVLSQAQGGVPFDSGFITDGGCAVTVNGPSHIGIFHASSDGKFYSAFNAVDGLDDRIGEQLDYAFSERSGFLFDNPAECGTGFSARALLHLPAVSMSNGQDEIRAICAEYETDVSQYSGSMTLPVFILSTKNVPGESEQEFCANILGAVSVLAKLEREAREDHLTRFRVQLEDLVWRSYGLLGNARLIPWHESAEYLFNIRLGAVLSVIDTFTVAEINRLIFETTDAFLLRFCGDDASAHPVVRAELIRRAMNKGRV